MISNNYMYLGTYYFDNDKSGMFYALFDNFHRKMFFCFFFFVIIFHILDEPVLPRK